MNLTTFTDIAEELRVLGVKVTQNNETIAEWYSEGQAAIWYIT